MNKKFLITLFTLIGLVIIFSIRINEDHKELVTMSSSASLIEMSLDDIINEADLIVIGEVKEILPSQWKAPNGKDLKSATRDEIFWAGGLFTDTMISINQVLKGNNKEPIVRVRSFIGETDQVRWADASEISYEQGQTYLLFLIKNSGTTARVDPGSYTSVNAYHGVYKIIDDKAVSKGDERVFEDLTKYIQESSLLVIQADSILDTPETKEIMKTIKKAYDVEAEAAYSFDISNFSKVFINDPSYIVDSNKLEFVKMIEGNPSIKAVGYLDYKIAYYTWWEEGLFHFEELQKKAATENRNLTKDELNAFAASKWGLIPGRSDDPTRYATLKFVSISINNDNDIAVVTLEDSSMLKELRLVLLEGQWYIIGCHEDIELPTETIRYSC